MFLVNWTSIYVSICRLIHADQTEGCTKHGIEMDEEEAVKVKAGVFQFFRFMH